MRCRQTGGLLNPDKSLRRSGSSLGNGGEYPKDTCGNDVSVLDSNDNAD